jgi:protein gp37
MGKDSAIEWTDHTFNPWWGCVKVSPGCKNCYAETLSKRFGHKVWGPQGERRFFGVKHWAEPLKWDRQAKAEGVRRRVFCGSMCDVFEEGAALNTERAVLWDLIWKTPNLDWLVLTKRPENIYGMVPGYWINHMTGTEWPRNIWIGTSVEDQQRADERIPELLKVPAKVRFLSCEPLLGQIDITPWLSKLQWVIVGGESGQRARPMHPEWARSLRDQCVSVGVPFFFKQWGEWGPAGWPRRPKELEQVPDLLERLGKKVNGRYLDGREWNEAPAGRATKAVGDGE